MWNFSGALAVPRVLGLGEVIPGLCTGDPRVSVHGSGSVGSVLTEDFTGDPRVSVHGSRSVVADGSTGVPIVSVHGSRSVVAEGRTDDPRVTVHGSRSVMMTEGRWASCVALFITRTAEKDRMKTIANLYKLGGDCKSHSALGHETDKIT